MIDETAHQNGASRDEYDSPWKDVIERFTESFFELLFPVIHRQVDWRVAPRFLDQHLPRLEADTSTPKGEVDRLIGLQASGEETWVLVHVEVQAQRDAAFTERMYRYHYRIHERQGEPPVSVAVLAADRPGWSPSRYEHGRWGCELRLDFPTAKLLDFLPRLDELEASDNPFAAVVIAHLMTQKTRGDPLRRARWKRRLTRLLLERWWSRGDILDLYRFLDGLMALPTDLAIEHREFLARELKEQKMPHLTYWERIGLEKGLERGKREAKREFVVQVLAARFGEVPAAITARLETVDDSARLDSMHRLAVVCDSLEAFEELLATES